MAVDNIVYPVRYELNRGAGPVLTVLCADNGLLMTCDTTSDYEMHHVVKRLNFASKVVARMKHYGFIEANDGTVIQLNEHGRIDVGSRRFNDWETAVEACIDVALEE